MSKVAPTFESIFTSEYWGDVQDKQSTPPCKAISRKVYKQMQSLTAMAANSIFEGNPTSNAPDGALLDISGDSFHTAPGTVLLADMEMLVPLPDDITPIHTFIDQLSPPVSQAFIHDQADLMALPATLFKQNSAIDMDAGPNTVVYPYTKYTVNPESSALYSRIIRLLTYGVDKNGDPTYRLIANWPAAHEKGVEGRAKKDENLSGLLPAVRIGETYHEGKDQAVIRLKSAEICLSGTIEYAKVKKKARGGLFAGRLATSASLGGF